MIEIKIPLTEYTTLHHRADDFLKQVDIETVIKFYYPQQIFEAIDAHVKGGTDPQFNQAYNKWRYNK